MESTKSLLGMVDTTTVETKMVVVVSLTTKMMVSLTTTVVEVSLTTNLQKFVSFLLAQRLPSTRCRTSSSGADFTNFTYRFLFA